MKGKKLLRIKHDKNFKKIANFGPKFRHEGVLQTNQGTHKYTKFNFRNRESDFKLIGATVLEI